MLMARADAIALVTDLWKIDSVKVNKMQKSVRLVTVALGFLSLSLTGTAVAFHLPNLNLLAANHGCLNSKCGQPTSLHFPLFSRPTIQGGCVLHQVADGKGPDDVSMALEMKPRTLEERISAMETEVNSHITGLKSNVTKIEAENIELKSQITQLSGQVLTLSKLQAVLISTQIMSVFFGLSDSGFPVYPPRHAKNADQTGSQLRNMLRTVLKVAEHNLDGYIDLIDELWQQRNDVAHPAVQSNKSIDELISILESRGADLDGREELALEILKQRDGILKAPRYPSKHMRDAVNPVNKATARPLGRPKQRKATV